MDEKYQEAQRLVDAGHTNKDILDVLRDRFGAGIALERLAEMRQTSTGRVKEQKAEAKRALIRQVLERGGSTYDVQKQLKRAFGEGCGHKLVQKIQTEIEAEATMEEAMEGGKVTPVSLPDDLHEEEPTTTEVVVFRPPDGGFRDFKAVQQWMAEANATDLHLTVEGQLSVTVRHQFDLGGVL